MNDALFLENWEALDMFTRKALRDFARKPTERNSCYVIGYIAALSDRGLLDDPGYWLAFISRTAEGNDQQRAILASRV